MTHRMPVPFGTAPRFNPSRQTRVLPGFPLALGSYWGLLAVVPGLLMLVIRIQDEEKLLVEQLDGYREYAQKSRYRLVPYMW